MSARKLALLLEVSPSWVSYRLTGTQTIDLNDTESIAAELDVSVGELLGIPDGEVPERLRDVVAYLADATVDTGNKDLLLRIIDRALLTVSDMPNEAPARKRAGNATR